MTRIWTVIRLHNHVSQEDLGLLLDAIKPLEKKFEFLVDCQIHEQPTSEEVSS